MNFSTMPCGNTVAERQHDIEQQAAHERHVERVTRRAKEIEGEIYEGKWNDDVFASSLFDPDDIVNLALAAANGAEPSAFAVRDFMAGVEALAEQIAENEL